MGIASTTQQLHHLTLDHTPPDTWILLVPHNNSITLHWTMPHQTHGFASTTQQLHHLTLDHAPPDTWVLLVPHNNPITSHWTTPHQTHGYC